MSETMREEEGTADIEYQDFYSKESVDAMQEEDDEVGSGEAGFMTGYNNAIQEEMELDTVELLALLYND
jgi:hypothetical protein